MPKNVLELYVDLIENPFTPKPYRNLSEFYKDKGLIEESEAFLSVLEESHEDTDTNVQ